MAATEEREALFDWVKREDGLDIQFSKCPRAVAPRRDNLDAAMRIELRVARNSKLRPLYAEAGAHVRGGSTR